MAHSVLCLSVCRRMSLSVNPVRRLWWQALPGPQIVMTGPTWYADCDDRPYPVRRLWWQALTGTQIVMTGPTWYADCDDRPYLVRRLWWQALPGTQIVMTGPTRYADCDDRPYPVRRLWWQALPVTQIVMTGPTWYAGDACGGQPKRGLRNFLQSVTTTTLTQEPLTCEQHRRHCRNAASVKPKVLWRSVVTTTTMAHARRSWTQGSGFIPP
jgi:hypothetical protein